MKVNPSSPTKPPKIGIVEANLGTEYGFVVRDKATDELVSTGRTAHAAAARARKAGYLRIE